MKQLAKKFISEKINKNNILIINLEDSRWPTNMDANFLQKIYEIYLEFINPDKNQKIYVFLDEVQEVEKWALTMFELKKAQVIISGSNANLLSQELATLLTGRHLDLTVFPLCFKEFLNFKKIKTKNNLDIIDQKIQIKRLFNEYFEFGSFPEVVLKENKTELLVAYFKDIVDKDLIKRYKIRKIEQFKSALKFYLSNVSNLITYSSLAKHFNVTAETIEKFSNCFEIAYALFFLKRFSFKMREQEKSPRKVYAIDTGLANVIGFRFSENKGRIAENIVFLELERQKSQDANLELYYWKDEKHQELDFVIKQGLKIKQLIQVCWDISDFEIKKRELRSLVKASKELKCTNLLVITEDFEGEEAVKNKKIKFMPLWQWLLTF